MKQIVEEILDSLILAHQLEVPTYVPIRTFLKIPIKDKLHILYRSPFALNLRQGVATLLLVGGIVALASLGERGENHTSGNIPVSLLGQEVHSAATDGSNVASPIYTVNNDEYIPRILTILKSYETSTAFLVTQSWPNQFPGDTETMVKPGHDLGIRRPTVVGQGYLKITRW
jgi:hypothetical protein